jgi:hypothetical protein
MLIDSTASVHSDVNPNRDTFRYQIITMTPERASGLLDRRRPGARRHAGAVRAYGQAMRESRWILNGIPIVMSRQGVLLDGLQRLSACVETSVAFETFLSEYVDDDACHTIDQQRRRSFANVLEARGVPHAHALQAALLKLMRYDSRTISEHDPTMPSWATMDRVLRANPWLEPAVTASLGLPSCPLRESVRSPLICMGYQVDREQTDRLLDALMRPERYASTEPGVLLWHEILREQEGPPQAGSTTRLLALAIKALDATVNRTTLRRLSWIDPGTRSGEAESFPRLRHYKGLATAAPVAEFEPSRDEVKDALGAITFCIETIDPLLAARYLEYNTGNRRISHAHVEAIARDLAQDRWMFNAQPICFAGNGRLLNGQHRLRAVIRAGRAIEVPVVRGLKEAAYATYDSQPKRRAGLGDPLDTFGDQALVYAIANLLWRHERKALSTRNAKATAAEVQQIVNQHPRLLLLRSFARKMGHFGRASVIGYAAYVMERDNEDLASRFLTALETGADQGPGHPILALRGTLQALRSSKAPPGEQLAALLGGWERFKARAASSGTSI